MMISTPLGGSKAAIKSQHISNTKGVRSKTTAYKNGGGSNSKSSQKPQADIGLNDVS